MSILANKDTRVVIQGGQAGVNAARRMAEFCYLIKRPLNVEAFVYPPDAGKTNEIPYGSGLIAIPVYKSIAEATKNHPSLNTSLVYIGADRAMKGGMEALANVIAGFLILLLIAVEEAAVVAVQPELRQIVVADLDDPLVAILEDVDIGSDLAGSGAAVTDAGLRIEPADDGEGDFDVFDRAAELPGELPDVAFFDQWEVLLNDLPGDTALGSAVGQLEEQALLERAGSDTGLDALNGFEGLLEDGQGWDFTLEGKVTAEYALGSRVQYAVETEAGSIVTVERPFETRVPDALGRRMRMGWERGSVHLIPEGADDGKA